MSSNRPEPPAIHRRIGTHAVARERMLGRLHAERVPEEGAPPLAALTTRDPADPTVALIDAAAVVLDVLAFYQERYGRETWLDTATERRSLVEIARSLGSEPGSGVAAAGWLAFEVAPGQDEVVVAAGTQVMSMPQGSDPPPRFETTAEIVARAAWSRVPAMPWLPVSMWPVRTDVIRLVGTSTRLVPGAALLLVDADSPGPPGTERFEFRRVVAVDPEGDRTRVQLERPIGETSRASTVVDDRIARPVRTAYALRGTASLFGAGAPDWWAQSEDLQKKAWIRANRSPSTFSPPEVVTPPGGTVRVLEWPDFDLSADPAVLGGGIDLDREVPGLAPGTWIVLEAPGEVEALRVRRVRPVGRSQFGLNSRVHRLLLERDGLSASELRALLARFPRRGTTVHLVSEPLARAADPWDELVWGKVLAVAGPVDPPLLGATVAVVGTLDGAPAGVVTEVTAVATELDGDVVDVTWLTLAADVPLLDRATVALCGNVAPATHGAAGAAETLGSGAASLPFQRFRIRQAPITEVPDPLGDGGVSTTARVQVGGREWTRVTTLADAGPTDEVYQLQRDHDGTAIVTFGDGEHGARLPTGTENVTATLRVGLGLAGNVAAKAASLFTRRPAGLQAAYNPVAFTGGAEPDEPENIRASAAKRIVAVDRLVALRDYELFGLGFAGVAKAVAAAAWTGQRRLVHLTVAPPAGTSTADADALLARVSAAVQEQRDPEHVVVVDLHTEISFGLDAVVRAPEDQGWTELDAALRAALLAAFGFAARTFAQPVTSSEILAVAHQVPGVVAVDLDALFRDGQSHVRRDRLTAASAFTDGVTQRRAELLLVDLDLVTLSRGSL